MNQKKDIKHHNSIIKYRKNCDEYQSQLIFLLLKITALKPPKSLLDKDKETKDQEINNLKQVDKRDNKDKIKQLQDELEEIVEQISDINSQICKLEAYQKYYQEILNDSENYKSILEERCEKDKKEYQNSILSELNSLYEIASAEG
ncbi:hypothetical protein [Candidatus Phytoplasma citri]|uniref:Uncharacterized protein n=1 Tax=Candidatus Phytoplasma citri TaxID=180978 RepID=A0ABU8ZS59_9MOLU|nr:hypothetical protein [Candidatus Phytoplasma aurantifolia]MDO8060341.1 hypothetical protein [Candidatus Phytoplasma aurantifolia]